MRASTTLLTQILMKKLLLVTSLILLGCQTAMPLEPVQTPAETAQAPLDYADYSSCTEAQAFVAGDNEALRWEDDGLRGSYSLNGTPVMREELAPFSGDEIEVVFFKADDDGSAAFDLLVELADQGNIDRIIDGSLYHRLGVLEEGTLNSTAIVIGETDLIAAMSSEKQINMDFIQVSQLGFGMPLNYSRACVMRVD
jgi:hypothetical protein